MFEFDAWVLICLPLLFAAGWWLRGFDSRVRATDHAAAPQSMFKGLNLLLNEQPDKAIDAFIDVVKLDPETIELHYALGNLFRRRGEIDRAVRIHTHLLNRADLPGRHRADALAEAGPPARGEHQALRLHRSGRGQQGKPDCCRPRPGRSRETPRAY